MNKKILVVDDEADIQELYKQRFRKEIKNNELVFLFAEGVQDALALMGTLNPMDIVLLLSDINMPGMTGFDLLQTAKIKYPWLTVFMISAYGDNENLNRARTLGAKDFLTKPIDFNLLRDKILPVISA